MVKQNSLTFSAIILTLSAVMAKIFSAIYRIFLTRILGGVGIGLYQLVFPVYSMCVVLSTTGIPLAVSKVVARHENSLEVVKLCFKFVLIISISLSVLLFSFSDSLAKIQGDERIAICFKLLAPSLVIIGVSSVLKGYFQGKMNYVPSAVSQIAEQFVKLTIGLILASVFVRIDRVYSIAGAVVAIVVSEIVSLVILLVNLKSYPNISKVQPIDKKQIIKDIFPITISNLVLPVAMFVDSLIVVKLLSLNFTKESSIYLYGIESGAVNNIATLPTMFSFAMATVIMPSFSSKNTKKDGFSKLFQLVFMITIPCVVLFVVAPQGILKILYSNRLQYGEIDANEVSSNLLRISGLGTLFLALSQIMSSYLQANDKRVKTIRNLLVGVGAKFVVEIGLLSNADVNIFALALANSMCYFVVFLLNYLEVRKIQKLYIEKHFYLKVLASVLLMIITYFMTRLLGQGLAIQFIAYVLAGLSYLFGIYLLNLLNFETFKKSKINNKNI